MELNNPLDNSLGCNFSIGYCVLKRVYICSLVSSGRFHGAGAGTRPLNRDVSTVVTHVEKIALINA